MGQNGQVVGCNLNFFMGLFFVTTVVLSTMNFATKAASTAPLAPASRPHR